MPDRKGWGSGPWDNETDRIEWEACGFKCVALRHPRMGHWCGYVGIQKNHPLHGVGYSDESHVLMDFLGRRMHKPIGTEPSFRVVLEAAIGGSTHASPDFVFIVHGGITYSDAILDGSKDEGLWWFGFDCAHCNDASPGMNAHLKGSGLDHGGTYRTSAYVVKETEKLAAQLREVADA